MNFYSQEYSCIRKKGGPKLIWDRLFSLVENYYPIADITIRDTLQGKYKAQLPGRCGYDLWRLP